MLNALLNPDAKNPPKGASREANTERGREWNTAGYAWNSTPKNCMQTTSTHTLTHASTPTHTHVVLDLLEEVGAVTLHSVAQKVVEAGQEVSKLQGECCKPAPAGQPSMQEKQCYMYMLSQHNHDYTKPNTYKATPTQPRPPSGAQAHNKSKDDRGDKCSQEPLPRLVGRQLDEAGTTEEET